MTLDIHEQWDNSNTARDVLCQMLQALQLSSEEEEPV